MSRSHRSIRLLEVQGCLLTWLIAVIPIILLIPPGQLDTAHCSFLNVCVYVYYARD